MVRADRINVPGPITGQIVQLLIVADLVIADISGLNPNVMYELGIWPVLLASAACFYLWWLGALLFDLAFVWNVHVRHSKLADEIETVVTRWVCQAFQGDPAREVERACRTSVAQTCSSPALITSEEGLL